MVGGPYNWVENGELVVQNGRQAGARCALNGPITLIGQAQDCDVRLNVEGVEAHHCLLLFAREGLLIRDLHSNHGTYVNGQRILASSFQEGDLLQVGPFQFTVELKPDGSRDAIRTQVAAVAAQQAALDEFETTVRENQEQAALFAKVVENKNKQLEVERAEVLQQKQKLQAQRARLAKVYRNLHRQLQNLELQEKAQTTPVAPVPEEVQECVLQLNTERELNRRRLQDGWHELREAQQRWRTRRDLERAALTVRRRELDLSESKLATIRARLSADIEAWAQQQQKLELELLGVNNRIVNQRLAIRKLESDANPPMPLVQIPFPNGESPTRPQESNLETLAGNLVDQQRIVAEAWERLAQLHATWESDRNEILDQLDAYTVELETREGQLQARQQSCEEAEHLLQQRQADLQEMRLDLVAWRSRLMAREQDWQQQYQVEQAHLEDRQRRVDAAWESLEPLRAEYEHLREHLQAQMEAESYSFEQERQKLAKLKTDLQQKIHRVEDERRLITEKSLAVESYRLDVAMQARDNAALQKLEKLREDWLGQNHEIIARLQSERQAAKSELLELDRIQSELQRQSMRQSVLEADLAERSTRLRQREEQFEQKSALLEQQATSALARCNIAEHQVQRLRDEIDRTAKDLFDDASPPILPMDRAA